MQHDSHGARGHHQAQFMKIVRGAGSCAAGSGESTHILNMCMMICALALVLLMDTSLSMSHQDYLMQRDGVRDAFLDPQLQQIIEREPDGVAVSVIEWASESRVVVPWMHLRTQADATQLAHAVGALNRSVNGFTALGDALHKGMQVLEHAPCEADRQIMDVSGDGISNEGTDVAPVRLQAQQQGVVINGLPIQARPEVDIERYYREQVITPGGFVIVANGMQDFGRAIRRKLILEITSR